MLIILTPTPADAPHSSLVHMFDVVRRALGAGDSVFTGQRNQEGAWSVGVDATLEALREAIRLELPALLLGTAFSYVHLLDALVRHPLSAPLPAGSRALETGGYKGRSRALPRSELHGLIHRQLGIAPSHVVGEYGMCELSSQAYDRAAGGGEFQSSNFKWESRQESTAKSQISNLKSEVGKRVFRFPPWARVQIVSPENGLEVGEGGSGLIKVIDLANVRSVMAVLTEDLGLRRGGGFELVGRAALAEPRGCSLMTEAIP